uniref:Uncharacterized protein n=1 Tax=Panagrolaimus davidi TaxID=227884 RepID=A0A914Q0W8_9BILA
MLIFGDFVPQDCNKLFISRAYDYYDIGNLTVTAELELVKNINSTTTIFVTNVTVDGNVNLGIPNSVCANIEYDEDNFPTPEFCSQSLHSPFNFTTTKPSFNLQIHFSNTYFPFYFGFADDGTFSYIDGTLFSPENSTFIEIEDQSYSHDVYTQTCTSFIPAPIPAKYFPKCKTFKSQIIILNSTNNFDIFASSYMFWSLSEKKIEATGNYTISGNYFFDYIINDDDELCTG